ncbi:MAG: protein translocase subunit SecF [Deltaproteobacteria bacterium]|nr:MAG: protein translocase subunit SecF [Deltaproteobacteria bacterium]
MLQIIKPDVNIDFVGNRRYAYAFSGVLTVLGLLAMAIMGPRYGIDFAGGTLLHLRFHQPVEVSAIRNALGDLAGDASVQDFGNKGEYLLRLPESAADLGGLGQKIKAQLDAAFGASSYEVLRNETVGPRVGKELRQKALLAVLFSTIMMGSYIALRFEIRFGVGAAVALLHDVIVAAGALVIANYEFDLTIVAALLTIVGFSVHDTVIVSDRIRENMRKSRRQSLAVTINQSINETLSRTVLTTGTAILVILALYLLGGSVIHGFAFTLLVGFLIGTYSSIFVASPIVLAFERSRASTPRTQRAAS